MAAWRYEISLLVLKNISQVSAANECNIFQHEKRNYLSPSGHVTSSIHDINTNEILNHFTKGIKRRDFHM